ncbi:MAG: hypothetical protein IJL24_06580, partial [Treponema sp.]|nr:hypothetical protein [Treponema sp.]
MKKNGLFFMAPLIGLALFCASCSGGGGSGGTPVTPTGFYPASGMTQLQSVNAPTGPITLLPTTKTLVISGIQGKKIYMARTNARDSLLKPENERVLGNPNSGASKAPALGALNAGDLFSHKKDARQIFEEDMLERIKEASERKTKGLSKNSLPIQASPPIDYNVGDEEKFIGIDSEGLSAKDLKEYTFRLIVKEDKYNIWVDTSDPNYVGKEADFSSNAAAVGSKFINGYELVSHIYGEPSDKLYNTDYSVYGNMAECSKTGTKINILLFSMLAKHDLNGYVTLDDFFPKQSINISNEGRFLYLDSSNIMNDLPTSFTTSLHEFSHYISRTKKYFEFRKTWTYWYGELLAMQCEDMMQKYLGVDDADVDSPGNMNTTPKGRLARANGGELFNGSNGDGAPVYSWGFMFGAWLSRNFGGIKFIKELATNNAVDMESIIAAVKTASGKDYDEKTLLRDFAEALIEERSNFGLNKDGYTEPTNPEYSKAYSGGTYDYKVTAINLWNPFYAWYDDNLAPIIDNATMPFADLPAANNYKKHWTGATPQNAFKGPVRFKDGTGFCNLGPRARA